MAINICSRISIVKPVYNGSERLEELIRGVAGQGDVDWITGDKG